SSLIQTSICVHRLNTSRHHLSEGFLSGFDVIQTPLSPFDSMMVLRLQQKLNRTAKKGVLFSIGVICYLLHLVFTGRVEIHNIVNLRNDNDVLRRKHQEVIKICCNIEKLLEFQVEAELQTEFELLQIGKKQEVLDIQAVKDLDSLSQLQRLGSHITLIFIVFSNGTVFSETELGSDICAQNHWRNKEYVLMSWRQGYTGSWRRDKKKGDKRAADGIGKP
ncbi:LOW QUALITY PROTEIN: hypothetical protein HID58_074528, partial [Brassica napus]